MVRYAENCPRKVVLRTIGVIYFAIIFVANFITVLVFIVCRLLSHSHYVDRF